LFLATCFKICSPGLPTDSFSGHFSFKDVYSLCLTVCPISLTVCPISLTVCPISLTVCPISLTVCPISLTVCPIHEWRQFFKTFKSNLSPFEKLRLSLFSLPTVFLTFFSTPRFKCFYDPFFIFSTVHISDPQTAALQIQRFISFFFISKLRLFEHSRCFLL